MNKQFKKLFVTCFLMIATCLSLGSVRASASGLTQSGASENSVSITWDAEENATAYHVYVGLEYGKMSKVKDLKSSATSAKITGLKAGTRYYVKVEYDYLSFNQTSTYTSSIGILSDAKTRPGKVKNVHQEKWWYFIKTFDVTWNQQTGADGYEYKVSSTKKKKFASGKSSSARASVSKNVSNSMVYTVQVRAFSKIGGKTVYGAWSDPCYCFTQPRVKSAKVSGKKLVVKWDKVSGATGYNIFVSTKPTKGYKKVKTVGKKVSSVSITKFSGKKISAKKKYYVYVQTVKKVGKKKYTSGKLYYWNTKTSGYGYF